MLLYKFSSRVSYHNAQLYRTTYRYAWRNSDQQARPKVFNVHNHRAVRGRLSPPRCSLQPVDALRRPSCDRLWYRNHDNRSSGLRLGNRISGCPWNARIIFSGSIFTLRCMTSRASLNIALGLVTSCCSC